MGAGECASGSHLLDRLDVEAVELMEPVDTFSTVNRPSMTVNDRQ